MPKRTIAGIGLVAVLTLAACADDEEEPAAATDPPATDAPETDSTDPPATDPPATDPPATDPPATDPPATDPPATDPPATDPPTTDAARTYDFSRVDEAVADFVEEWELNGAGLIVVHRDEGVLHHEHWGVFDEDRISLVASSSKMVTAGVLLALQDDGLLDMDAPVADVAAWGAGNPDVTPAQLVSNSSGLVGLGPDPTYGPYLCQFLPNGTMQECAEQIFSTADDDGDIIPPDTEFRYGGAQWQVAGAVAEAASGKTWDELIEETYVEPCGLEALGYNNHFTQVGAGGFEYPEGFDGDLSLLESTANPNMEGGMYVTTGDYGKLLLMHLRDGVCGDEQVLSPDALAQMHGDRIAEVYDGTAGAETGYGMGWWVDRTNSRITDPGAYGSVPWLELDAGYGAFLVIEKSSDVGQLLASSLYDLVHDAVTG